MAGLLPGILPDLSLPAVGGLLGNPTSAAANNPTPVVITQPQFTADDDDNDDAPEANAGLSLITIINGPTSATDASSPDQTSTPLSDALQTTLQTVTTPTGLLSNTASQTLALTSGIDPSATSVLASSDGGEGGMSKGMIATVAGASGAGLVLVIVGIMLFTRSRRGKWPFNRRQDSFVSLDDEMEKNSAYNEAKWDPSRAGGLDSGRISRFISNRQRD